jgi:cell division protein FtsB
MDWAQILVIILSVFLAIFLLLGIVLAVLLIRLTQQIRSVTTSAQNTVKGFESLAANVSKFSSPSLIAKLVFSQARKLKKRKGEKNV